MLRAFKSVLEQRPDARLDIAGRGILEHGLKDLARELGLSEAVSFLGHVTPIQRAIEESQVVVVPSLGEGFGMGTGQMLRCGFLAGFRYLRFDERLDVFQRTTLLQDGVAGFFGTPLATGDTLFMRDSFNTRTQFWGPQIGALTAPALQATLTSALPAYAAANPDTTDTLAADATQSQGVWPAASTASASSYSTLAWLSPQPTSSGGAEVLSSAGELLAFGAVSATGTYTANLSYLERGLYGTGGVARLEEAEHGIGKNSREWLDRAVTAMSDPRYVCATCGGESLEWRSLCSHCGSFDALAWRTPWKHRATST